MGKPSYPPALWLIFRGAGNSPAYRKWPKTKGAIRLIAQVNPIQAQKFLGGMNYQADEVFNHAEQQGADENVLLVWRRILDRQYDGPNAVSREISEAR